MTFAIVPRENVMREAWDDLVLGSPDGWVFSLWGWQELIENAPWGLEDHSFAITEGKRLHAVVPLHYQPGSGVMASSGWGGSGPVIDGKLSGKSRSNVFSQAIKHAKDLARERGATALNISLSPVSKTSIDCKWGVNPLQFYGLKDCSGLSQVVDLSLPDDELWTNLASDARQQIRRARKDGFTVERVDWRQHLDRYYELHIETYTRTGVDPHPRAYFEGMAKHTAPDGHSVLWAAFAPDGEVVSYHNAAWFADGASYHTGCSSNGTGTSGESYLLFWEALLGAKRAGIRWYDCGNIFPGESATAKQKGLSTFKMKFGGEPHNVFGGIVGYEYVDSPTSLSEPAQPIPLWKRVVGKVVRLINPRRPLCMTRSVAQKIYYKLQFPVKFIRPFWSWEEIKEALFWQDAKPSGYDALSRAFRDKLGIHEDSNVYFLSSGRSALEAVFIGLAEADKARNKVIIPSYGCLGILQPVINAGLQPKFVDIDEDLMPSSEHIIASINSDTLAILLVHLSGKGKLYSEVRAHAKKKGVYVVDDFCHNFGGWPGGADAEISVYSFAVGKNASATAGGAIVDNIGVNAVGEIVRALDVEPSSNARHRFFHFLCIYGPFWIKWMGAKLPDGSDAMGSRYCMLKMSELDSKLLVAQIGKLDKIIRNRQKNAAAVRRSMELVDGIYHTQSIDHHIYTKMTVVLNSRDIFEQFMSFMNKYGIEIEGMYSPLHLRKNTGESDDTSLARTMDVYPRTANVPVRPNLTWLQVQKIKKTIEKFNVEVGNGQD